MAKHWRCSRHGARAIRAGSGLGHESWSFRLLQETFVPDFNLGPGIATALSLDRTMLAARDRVLDPAQATTRSLPGLLPRLRAAGVRSLLSIEPLEDPALESWAVVSPPDLDLYRALPQEWFPRPSSADLL